jgi:hypothetical protein
MNGITSNWDAFVEWLKGLIGGIFGGSTGAEGVSGIQSTGLSAAGTMTGRSGATYNLYVSTTAPISTIVQDFGMLQALAGA